MGQSLILHSGLMKTGSTALEHFCEINADVLKRHNVLFIPDRLYEYWPAREEPYRKALDKIEANLGASHDLLICDESIYPILAMTPEKLDIQKRFPSLNIKVVLYLRRQDLLIESLVNFLQFSGFLLEPFKWIEYPYRFTTTFPGVTDKSYDFYSWLKPLGDNIGAENISIRVFEPKQFVGGDLFRDFVDAIGVPFDNDFVVQKKRANKSLDQRFTSLIEKQYAMFPNPSNYEKSTATLAFLALNKAMGFTSNRNMFTAEERRGIIAHFEEGNDRIAREFLGRDGHLFDQTISDDEGPDVFAEGELELVPALLNKVWFETLADMDFGTFNSFKMRVHQDRYHAGVDSSRRKYKLHKLINSIGKRLFKKFYSPIDFSDVTPRR